LPPNLPPPRCAGRRRTFDSLLGPGPGTRPCGKLCWNKSSCQMSSNQGSDFPALDISGRNCIVPPCISRFSRPFHFSIWLMQLFSIFPPQPHCSLPPIVEHCHNCHQGRKIPIGIVRWCPSGTDTTPSDRTSTGRGRPWRGPRKPGEGRSVALSWREYVLVWRD